MLPSFGSFFERHATTKPSASSKILSHSAGGRRSFRYLPPYFIHGHLSAKLQYTAKNGRNFPGMKQGSDGCKRNYCLPATRQNLSCERYRGDSVRSGDGQRK